MAAGTDWELHTLWNRILSAEGGITREFLRCMQHVSLGLAPWLSHPGRPGPCQILVLIQSNPRFLFNCGTQMPRNLLPTALFPASHQFKIFCWRNTRLLPATLDQLFLLFFLPCHLSHLQSTSSSLSPAALHGRSTPKNTPTSSVFLHQCGHNLRHWIGINLFGFCLSQIVSSVSQEPSDLHPGAPCPNSAAFLE